jgi:hypothetical protein
VHHTRLWVALAAGWRYGGSSMQGEGDGRGLMSTPSVSWLWKRELGYRPHPCAMPAAPAESVGCSPAVEAGHGAWWAHSHPSTGQTVSGGFSPRVSFDDVVEEDAW